MLKEQNVRVCTIFIWLLIGSGEDGNEWLASINGEYFLGGLSGC
jgi:hypothetical protein